MDEHVSPGDVVVGISASGGARFVVAALERARAIGALTVAITSSDASALVRRRRRSRSCCRPGPKS